MIFSSSGLVVAHNCSSGSSSTSLNYLLWCFTPSFIVLKLAFMADLISATMAKASFLIAPMCSSIPTLSLASTSCTVRS